MALIQRYFSPPDESFFLFGPRGTGKSTFLASRYSDNNTLWIDLLKPDIYRYYIAYPERLVQFIQGNPRKKTIIIDEIQKAPGLLSIIHQLMEENKQLQFILTGSSARKLKRTGADLLGGRALKRTLHPFMASELGEHFNFSHAITTGLLPLLRRTTHPNDILHAYIELYLQEEIQAEGLVRNLENFSRFLEVISFSHGSLLNITNIARECEVNRKTVENYVQVLEDLLLAFQLPLFTRRAQRALSSHPKFYLFDAGVFSTLRPKGPLDNVSEIEGVALEGLVAQHLRAWIEYSKKKPALYFWRTRSGVEVDFIVYGENTFWAIEVKNTKRIHKKDIKGLQTFAQDYPMAKLLLLYRGETQIKIDSVLCVPCEKFFLQLTPNQPLFAD